jgi:hypothetical protein
MMQNPALPTRAGSSDFPSFHFTYPDFIFGHFLLRECHVCQTVKVEEKKSAREIKKIHKDKGDKERM